MRGRQGGGRGAWVQRSSHGGGFLHRIDQVAVSGAGVTHNTVLAEGMDSESSGFDVFLIDENEDGCCRNR
jgi:hypothetical protein